MLIAVVMTSFAVACFSLSVTALVCALQNARSASFFLFRWRRQFPRRKCPYAQNKYADMTNWKCFILIFYRTFLTGFGGISGQVGRAMVRILARRIPAKILMVRPNESDKLPRGWQKGGGYQSPITLNFSFKSRITENCFHQSRVT